MYVRTALAVLTTTWLLSSCGADKTPAAVIRPVRTMTVHLSDANDQRIFAGVTKAGAELKLSFRVPGKITKLPVKVGDQIHKDDVIAKLDTHDYELQVEQAEAAVLRSGAQERQAVSQYDRVSKLYETESASRAELDAARAQAESAKASRTAAKKQWELAKSQLAYTILHSPEDGDVAAVPVEANENIAAGQPVVQLNAGGISEVIIALPESLVARVHSGDPVTVTFDAHPNEAFPAIVTEVGVSRQMQPAYPVKVQLLHQISDLRSGMSAEVQFNFGSADDDQVIVVPSYAVSDMAGQQYVFVIKDIGDGFGMAEKRGVKVAGFVGDGLRIVDGLNDGDVVATAGIQFLEDGQRVRLPEHK